MSAPTFDLESDANGCLRVTGAISFANAGRALAQMPGPSRGSAVKIDLGALNAADSATLAVLIAWCAGARRAGATLHYLNAPQGLRNLARLCEVDAMLFA